MKRRRIALDRVLPSQSGFEAGAFVDYCGRIKYQCDDTPEGEPHQCMPHWAQAMRRVQCGVDGIAYLCDVLRGVDVVISYTVGQISLRCCSKMRLKRSGTSLPINFSSW